MTMRGYRRQASSGTEIRVNGTVGAETHCAGKNMRSSRKSFLARPLGVNSLTIRLAAAFICASSLAQIPTQHNDAFRTGANLSETTLTVANVNSSRFGRVATFPVDGDVYAQPLFLPRINIRGGQRDLVLVATANNSLYAFDADASGVPAPLWKRAYGNAVPMPSDDFANLMKTCRAYTSRHGAGLPPESARIAFDDHVEYNMRQIGITGTPVVDPATNTIYFATFSRDPKATHSGPCMNFQNCTLQAVCSHPVYTYHYFLHAVDAASGGDRAGSPVEIAAAAPGTSAGSVGGVVTFEPARQLQRAAILLAQSPQPALYIAFTGHGDVGYYHGWVLAYDPATLKKLGTFLDAPDKDPRYPVETDGDQDLGEQAGIWQSGQGPVADSDGNIYVMTGNGSNTIGTGHNYGDSFIKLRLASGALTVVKAWSPTPNETGDNDLGSAGPLLVENGSLLVGGGKFGVAYILDRNLALQQQFYAVVPPAGSNCDVAAYPGLNPMGYTTHIHGSPVFWKGSQRTFLYVWGENDCLRAFPLDAGRVPISSNPVFHAQKVGAATSFSTDVVPHPAGEEGMPGGILTLSANGNREGTAIVWASRPISGTTLQKVPPGMLEAFDATNVGHRLWSSEEFAADKVGKLARFTPPIAAGGRVFMATFSAAVMAYGALPTPRAVNRSAVTVLTRNPTDASLYRVSAAGGVQSTFWDKNWGSWFPVGTRTGWAPAGSLVSTLSRNSSDGSLYAVGNDGGVYTNWWANGSWHDWSRIGPSFTTLPGSPIRAVSRSSSDASIYVVGKDGGVYGASWSNGTWHDWFRIGGSFTLPVRTALDKVSRNPSDLSLYAVGQDGGVYSAFWVNGNWTGWFRIGSPFATAPASPVHTASRNSSDASLYVVGGDGGVYTNFWASGKWNSWSRVDKQFVAPKGADVAALSRNSTDVSLYVAGGDGGVYTNFWANGSWSSWSRVDFVSPAAGSAITVLSRPNAALNGDASLYLVGKDGIVRSTIWNGAWQPWITIP
jgi:hypothetical protein